MKEAIESSIITPLKELKSGFEPFLEMTEKVIDQKSLLLSPPEFMINPNYNETLSEISSKRDEAYNRIMELFHEVTVAKMIDK